MQGWIKLHRKLLEWEWYDEPNTFRLFIHCLLKVNHKDKSYRGQLVKSGTFLTSRELLSEETGLTERQVRTSLKRLEMTNELTINSTRKGTVIQVVKFKEYQIVDQQGDQQTTNKRPTSDQQTTSNNNDKNDKNEKKYSIKDIEFFNKVFDEKFKMQINSFLAKEFPKWVHDEFRFGQPHIDRFQNKWKNKLPKYWTFYTVSQAREQYLEFIKENFLKPEVSL